MPQNSEDQTTQLQLPIESPLAEARTTSLQELMDRPAYELTDEEFVHIIAENRRLKAQIAKLELEGKRAPRAIKGIPATEIQDLKDLEL